MYKNRQWKNATNGDPRDIQAATTSSTTTENIEMNAPSIESNTVSFDNTVFVPDQVSPPPTTDDRVEMEKYHIVKVKEPDEDMEKVIQRKERINKIDKMRAQGYSILALSGYFGITEDEVTELMEIGGIK